MENAVIAGTRRVKFHTRINLRLLVKLSCVLLKGIFPFLFGDASEGETLEDTNALQNVRDVDLASELGYPLQKDTVASIYLRAAPLYDFLRTVLLQVDGQKPAAV